MLQVLDHLEQHSREIATLPVEDRVLYYQRINPLLLALKGELRKAPNPFAQDKVIELEWHLASIAHLDEPSEQTDPEHLQGALQILQDLRGPHGFLR
ncbi:MAG TPA: hypothetical protein DCZ69_14885 [Syntrophobacteraceae bacterium]|nr:hypothetical protein [Syntrophobacteraceae bacterium]HBD09536.1 hypothetical protein [Syntrophobacteraceae bacterium]HBZ56495.1 hypothetical protein [Syntrophobacteraceae bacterium]